MRYYSQYDDLVGIIDEYKIGWTAPKSGGILSFKNFWIKLLSIWLKNLKMAKMEKILPIYIINFNFENKNKQIKEEKIEKRKV